VRHEVARLIMCAEMKPNTKIARIRDALNGLRGLNRFDAERLGDHCLNSTIAELRAKGVVILALWEEVPTRFGRDVWVKRYWAYDV
jgi:hypothetical protein